MMRRLVLLLCLLAVVASTGTASGARDPLYDRLLDDRFPRMRQVEQPAKPMSTPARVQTRVIVTLDDPPLAAAAPRSAFTTTGPVRRLSVQSTFARSYMSKLQT